jgi:glyoxylase-like metal-dependent hydrolase (beta-lactamase superfamily II)
MEQVAPGIYALSGLKIGRSYLIDDRDGLTLIDTSSASASGRIFDALHQLRRPPRDLRLIVATHYHLDHTGNVAALAERSGAEFAVHAQEAPYVDGRTPWKPVDGAAALLAGDQAKHHYTLRVDRELREGDVLAAAGGLRVVHAPGHTPGHIALHSPERGVLFSGDAFINVLGLRLPPRASSHDMGEARRTVRRLSGLSFDIALPGHGRPLQSRASEKLAAWSEKWL